MEGVAGEHESPNGVLGIIKVDDLIDLRRYLLSPLAVVTREMPEHVIRRGTIHAPIRVEVAEKEVLNGIEALDRSPVRQFVV